MTESKMSFNAIAKPVNHTMTMIKLAVFAVSVAAAIPTARDLYYSWQTGVPFSQVSHRLNQASLLERNFGCNIRYTQISNVSGARVEVGSCPKTGDIAIRVTRDRDTNFEWIAFDQLPKPNTSVASLMDLFISKALADERAASGASQSTIRVAQANVEVLCQGKLKDMLVRVVRENGKCRQESVSIFKGTLEQSVEVPCNSACPIKN